jgi:hypothetical protein
MARKDSQAPKPDAMLARVANNMGVSMGRLIGAGMAAFTLGLLATSALATPPAKCAKPDEVSAIQAAAIQQQLMVAALTCNEITNFNAFQTSFGPELRTSDSKLEHMFKRLFGGGRGEAEYHAFKTRLANNSSISSIHDNQTYCHAASMVFAAALTAQKPALTDFVAGIPVTDPSPVDSCQMQVAGGLVGAPAAVIVPKPNPLRLAMATPMAPMMAPAVAPDVQAPPATPAQKPATDPQKDQQKKPSGWFSGIFN